MLSWLGLSFRSGFPGSPFSPEDQEEQWDLVLVPLRNLRSDTKFVNPRRDLREEIERGGEKEEREREERKVN